MDRLDLERERGITIAAKNCAVRWRGTKINIIDTPGHADFGGEVERALSMVDGAIVLVDAAEGPLPQTRFVLGKALSLGLQLILVVNKIDRPDARPAEVVDEVLALLIDLDADEEQLDLPILYAIGRDGIARAAVDGPEQNLDALLDTIVRRNTAAGRRPHAAVPNVGLRPGLRRSPRTAGGGQDLRREGGVARSTYPHWRRPPCNRCGLRASRFTRGWPWSAPKSAEAGDIAVLSGVEQIQIGDTICTAEAPLPLPRITVDEPTVSMRFAKNTSPLAGTEGGIVQMSRIRERLHRETLQNVSIEIEDCEHDDSLLVKGRGEFQLAILIETMRREGFELCVGRPQVILRMENGKRMEPIEQLTVDCGGAYTGIVTEKLVRRKGHLLEMSNHAAGRVQLQFRIPTRGLIGYRPEFLTDTRGTGVMNSYVAGYEPYRGDFTPRPTGSLVCDRSGRAVPYAIFNLEPRGRMFVRPGDPVYAGMIVGEHNRDNDLDVNMCRTKKLTNMRAAGKDDAVTLTPVTPLALEAGLQFIRDDEMVEATPKSLRMRKATLSAQHRRVMERRQALPWRSIDEWRPRVGRFMPSRRNERSGI